MDQPESAARFTSNCPMEKLWDELSKVPAGFTLNVSDYSISLERLKIVKTTVEEKAQELEHAAEKYDQDDEELIQALDLLTWLEFNIGCQEKAMHLNKKACDLTNNKSCFSLGNCAHLMWLQGDLEQTRSCLNNLAKLKEVSSERSAAFVKAHQAYCYFRLGGRVNLQQALKLYKEALEVRPDSHLWRHQAGIVSKRLSHPNMYSINMRFDARAKAEKEDLAISYFKHVAEFSRNPKLRGRAYSDLASLAAVRQDRSDIVRTWCEKAQSNFSIDTYVLLNCSRAFKRIDQVSQALKCLQITPNKIPNSRVLAERGSCFQLLAKNERKKYERERLNDLAELNYREAVNADPLNLPAYYSVANILKARHKYQEALELFKKLLTSAISWKETHYAQTIMKSYEQAALCQLRLVQDPSYLAHLPSFVTESDLKKEAENMLMKALEIGFNILSSEDTKKYLSYSFTTLLDLGKAKNTPEALKLLSRVYQLVNEKEKSLHVLKKLLSDMSEDPDVIIFALKGYLDLQNYEEAYILLQLSRARISPSHIDKNLVKQVTLFAARAQLMQLTAQTAGASMFKSLFDTYRLQSRLFENAEELLDEKEPLDVLIFYDDSWDRSEGDSSLTAVRKKMQEKITSVFGLNVGYNLPACCAGKPKTDAQLEEMRKAEVVLVVIGEEPMDGYFKSFLHFLPSISGKSEDNPRPPRVLVAQTKNCVGVPSPISIFPKTPPIESALKSLETLEQKCVNAENAGSRFEGSPVDDDTVSKCVEDIMVFFCCLISTEWPLPGDTA